MVAPIVTFYKLTPGGLAPRRTTRSAAGSIPALALRYCEAVCTASAFGYYVFPPIDFIIQWDGSEAYWSYDQGGTWHPVQTSQFPGFRQQFNEIAPDDCKGFSPPFITLGATPGIVQIWSGVIAKTAPD